MARSALNASVALRPPLGGVKSPRHLPSRRHWQPIFRRATARASATSACPYLSPAPNTPWQETRDGHMRKPKLKRGIEDRGEPVHGHRTAERFDHLDERNALISPDEGRSLGDRSCRSGGTPCTWPRCRSSPGACQCRPPWCHDDGPYEAIAGGKVADLRVAFAFTERGGAPEEAAMADVYSMTNTYLTGRLLLVDGGGSLI